MKTNANRGNKSKLWLGILFSCIVSLIPFIVYHWKFHGSLESDPAKWGVYGDFVGGVTSPFLNFCAITFSIWLFYRQQNSDTIGEFKSMFFTMISHHNEMASQVHFEPIKKKGEQDKPPIEQGKTAFKKLYSKYKTNYRMALKDNPNDYRKAIQEAFERFYQRYGHGFDSYFKNMNSILRLIEKDASAEDAQFYADIFRSQWSKYEMLLLFYDSLGKEKEFASFRSLIIKYKLLHGLDFSELIDEINHKGLFPDSAYEASH